MKKYKLIQDLPTFKAGSLFELDDDGSLYYINKDCYKLTLKAPVSRDRIMAYNKRTLEKFPNILEDWFVELGRRKRRAKSTKEALDKKAAELVQEFCEKWRASFSGVFMFTALSLAGKDDLLASGATLVTDDLVDHQKEALAIASHLDEAVDKTKLVLYCKMLGQGLEVIEKDEARKGGQNLGGAKGVD